jgi:hypothetical protein
MEVSSGRVQPGLQNLYFTQFPYFNTPDILAYSLRRLAFQDLKLTPVLQNSGVEALVVLLPAICSSSAPRLCTSLFLARPPRASFTVSHKVELRDPSTAVRRQLPIPQSLAPAQVPSASPPTFRSCSRAPRPPGRAFSLLVQSNPIHKSSSRYYKTCTSIEGWSARPNAMSLLIPRCLCSGSRPRACRWS